MAINARHIKKEYAGLIVRIAVSLVVLWFGISQLVNPESFLGYMPQWLYPHAQNMMHHHTMQFMHNIPIPSVHFILIANGIFETIFGLLLIAGIFTRISALLLSIHLFGIMLGLGYNDIAVRDFGIALATLSVFFNGYDNYCLDKKIMQSKMKSRLLRLAYFFD